MNLTSLLRNHPDLAEMIGGPREHLVKCADCPHHFPPDQLYRGGEAPLCATCFDWRQEVAWAGWLDRLAKESREGTA